MYRLKVTKTISKSKTQNMEVTVNFDFKDRKWAKQARELLRGSKHTALITLVKHTPDEEIK